jgi:integrase
VPKPYIFPRPAGLYARFLVPAALRPVVGSRFIVRPLYAATPDEARLAAAALGLLLSKAFQALRGGAVVDAGKVVKDAQARGVKKFEWDGATGSMKTDGSAGDNAAAIEFMRLNRATTQQAQAAATPVATPAPKKTPLLSKAISDYLKDLETAAKSGLRAKKTVIESAHSLRLLAGVVKDKPISELTADDMRAFQNAAQNFPLRAYQRKEYAGKTVAYILAQAVINDDDKKPAPWTLEKHRQRLAAFLNHWVKAKALPNNPMYEVGAWEKPDTEEDTGRPFTPAELSALFEPVAFQEWAKKYPHRWFGVLLGLFSGARVTEIAQLDVADVEHVEGVWGFCIRPNRVKGKKVKTKESRRFVPIAQPVLDAGFLDYVTEAKAAGQTRLFPNLPNSTGLGFGRQLSRQFSDYAHKQVPALESGGGFHYFRHTLATSLYEAGVQERVIAMLTGHKHQEKPSVLADFYLKHTLPARVAALTRFVPSVTLPKYRAGQFAGALARATEKAAKKKVTKPAA